MFQILLLQYILYYQHNGWGKCVFNNYVFNILHKYLNQETDEIYVYEICWTHIVSYRSYATRNKQCFIFVNLVDHLYRFFTMVSFFICLSISQFISLCYDIDLKRAIFPLWSDPAESDDNIDFFNLWQRYIFTYSYIWYNFSCRTSTLLMVLWYNLTVHAKIMVPVYHTKESYLYIVYYDLLSVVMGGSPWHT